MTPLEDPFPPPGSWRASQADPPLSAEACLELVGQLPPWSLGPHGAELVFRARLPTGLSALYLLGLALDFGKEIGVSPQIEVQGRSVIVKVGEPSGRALTQRDFRFARRLCWVEGVALGGAV